MLSGLQLVAFDSIHTLDAMYAPFAHSFRGSDVSHRSTGIATDKQLKRQQSDGDCNNSCGQKQYFQHFVRYIVVNVLQR